MCKTISTAALAVLTVLSTGCVGSGDANATNAADTPAEERDHLDASEQAAARARAYDSILEPR
jgi:hypothetical protein